MRTFFLVAWLGWGALFLVFEGMALFNAHRADTLSEHVWQYFRPHLLARMAVGGLLGWLVYHFLVYAGTGYSWLDALSVVLGASVGLVSPRWRGSR